MDGFTVMPLWTLPTHQPISSRATSRRCILEGGEGGPYRVVSIGWPLHFLLISFILITGSRGPGHLATMGGEGSVFNDFQAPGAAQTPKVDDFRLA